MVIDGVPVESDLFDVSPENIEVLMFEELPPLLCMVRGVKTVLF